MISFWKYGLRRTSLVLAALFWLYPASAQSPDEDTGGSVLGGGGDSFSVNTDQGGGDDTFNGGGDDAGPGTDLFNANPSGSGSGGGGGGSPPPLPNPPCGMNSMESRAWGGGDFGTSMANWIGALMNCNAPRRPSPTVAVFHYFYINGINTPMSGQGRAPGDPGGTYLYEYGLVNRIVSSKQIKLPNIPQIDHMENYTHNPSGTDPLFASLTNACSAEGKGQWTGSPAAIAAQQNFICGLASWATGFDKWRASGAGGMAPMDLVECFIQALGPPGLRNWFPGISPLGTSRTAFMDGTVAEVVYMIDRIYMQEPRGPIYPDMLPNMRVKNYFIVVAHSQGNFFAEGVGYRLANGTAAEKYILAHRLAILSLGSPTRYDSLPTNFVNSRLVHITRADDAIHMVDWLTAGGLIGKQSWPRSDDVAPLWPWRPGILDGYFKNAPSGLDVMQLPSPSSLLTPLENAHLMDNYFNNPTATPPPSVNRGKYPLPRECAEDMQGPPIYAPQGPPVLATAVGALRTLKSSLLYQQ